MAKPPEIRSAGDSKRKLEVKRELLEAQAQASASDEKRQDEVKTEIQEMLAAMAEHGKPMGIEKDRVGIEKDDPAFSAHLDAILAAAPALSRDNQSGFAISRSASAKKKAYERGGQLRPEITRVSCKIGVFVGLCKRFGVEGEHVAKWVAQVSAPAGPQDTSMQSKQ